LVFVGIAQTKLFGLRPPEVSKYSETGQTAFREIHPFVFCLKKGGGIYF
jgi:hypothetical protein